jgi:hypothetical protein
MSRTLRLELTAAPQPLGGCDDVRWRLQIGLGDSEVLGGTTAPLSRSGGLLSPALSSKGGEGDQSIGWWQCQAPLAVLTCVERASELQHPARNEY